MARRSRRLAYWPVLVGAAVGLLIWVHDYEFFLNVGGPDTPLSDTIRRASGTERSSYLVHVYWPAVVLLFLGAWGGFLVSWLFAILRGRAPE